MSDKISVRLDATVAAELRQYVDTTGGTVSGVVNDALRQFLGVPSPGGTDPAIWEAIAALTERLDALEAARPTPVVPSVRQANEAPSRTVQRPPATLPDSDDDGLLSDADVAAAIGRDRRGMTNTIRRLGLDVGDTFEGFEIVGRVVPPGRGGPARRRWRAIAP